MSTSQYLAVVIQLEDNGAVSAYVPDLPGVYAAADTQAGALRGIREALEGYLDALRARDWQRPARSGLIASRPRTMARRSRDWNRDLALDLRDAEFAREFLLAAIDDGVSLQRALGKVIRAIGVTEFAVKIRMASPNVLRAIHPRHHPTRETLNRLLRPFRLRLSLVGVESRRRSQA